MMQQLHKACPHATVVEPSSQHTMSSLLFRDMLHGSKPVAEVCTHKHAQILSSCTIVSNQFHLTRWDMLHGSKRVAEVCTHSRHVVPTSMELCANTGAGTLLVYGDDSGKATFFSHSSHDGKSQHQNQCSSKHTHTACTSRSSISFHAHHTSSQAASLRLTCACWAKLQKSTSGQCKPTHLQVQACAVIRGRWLLTQQAAHRMCCCHALCSRCVMMMLDHLSCALCMHRQEESHRSLLQ